MEYLMTYGWALLVIVVVIAILLVINPLQPPAGCRFDQMGFTCSDPLLGSNGLLYLKVTNGNNNNVEIYGMNCTSDKSPKPPAFNGTTTGSRVTSLQRQETLELPGIQCYDAKGAKLVPAAGSDFSGKLWIFYKNEEDGASYPMRSISANVVSKVVAASP